MQLLLLWEAYFKMISGPTAPFCRLVSAQSCWPRHTASPVNHKSITLRAEQDVNSGLIRGQCKTEGWWRKGGPLSLLSSGLSRKITWEEATLSELPNRTSHFYSCPLKKAICKYIETSQKETSRPWPLLQHVYCSPFLSHRLSHWEAGDKTE